MGLSLKIPPRWTPSTVLPRLPPRRASSEAPAACSSSASRSRAARRRARVPTPSRSRSSRSELPRQPGSRENRWAHLLSGAPDIEVTPAAAPSGAELTADVTVSEIAALKANVARLEAEVDALKGVVGKLCAELGVSG